MANVEWALCCDYAFYDEKRKACMIGYFDRIWAVEFPTKYPVFYVVSKWTGEPNVTFKERTTIIAPDGTQVSETRGVDMTASSAGGAGIISRFVGVTFPQAGMYRVEFLADGEVVASIALTLALQE